MPDTRPWARERAGRAKEKPSDDDDLSLPTEGVLLNLTLVGDGIISSVYTYTLQTGSQGAQFPVQVDTGSSDSWIVSSACSSEACKSYTGAKFDPSALADTQDTGDHFEIQYLQGYVSGPIFWNTFDLGPYQLSSQAFGAATVVQNEQLSTGFAGLLALALPLNSKIAQIIPPTNGNTPDGAPIVSNLFGLGEYGPREHFISILLERPGITRIPSMLGLGRHPIDILPNITSLGASWNESLVFNRVVQYEAGALFWATSVTELAAYVNGSAIAVDLGKSDADPNAVQPIGILDTGSPYIFARTDIVNAFYGTYGIGPGSDGVYYVPCSMAINMSISLNDQAFPIHPLDLTYVSDDGHKSDDCVSAFQASASLVNADFILGAAFLRNVYSVLSYNRKGSKAYEHLTISENDPAIALLSVTNIAQALDEFNTVRVKHEPLPSSSSLPTPGTSTDSHGSRAGKHGLGRLWILIGVLLALSMVVGAFLTRCLVRRRRSLKRVAAEEGNDSQHRSGEKRSRNPAGIPIALTSLGSHDEKSSKFSRGPLNADNLDEETLHTKRGSGWGWHRHSSASFMSSSTGNGSRAIDGTEFTTEFGEVSLSTVAEAGDQRRSRGPASDLVTDGIRSGRATRSRSRGAQGTIPDPTYPTHTITPLVSDASLLTNIPTLEEITPEALSSSRYSTFDRRDPTSPGSRRHSSLSRAYISDDLGILITEPTPTQPPSHPHPHPHPLSISVTEDSEIQSVLHHRTQHADCDPVSPSPSRPVISGISLSS